jgi:hypothetical protein
MEGMVFRLLQFCSHQMSDVIAQQQGLRRITLDRDNPAEVFGCDAKPQLLQPHRTTLQVNHPQLPRGNPSYLNASLILFTLIRSNAGAEQIRLYPRRLVFAPSPSAMAPAAPPSLARTFKAIVVRPVRQIGLWQSAVHWNL